MKTFIIIMALVALAVVGLAWLRAAYRAESLGRIGRIGRIKGMRRKWKKIYLMPIGIHRLVGWLPGQSFRPTVQFANIGEGTYEHGRKSYIADAATTARYLLYKKGTDVDHCALAGAGDDPLGPSDDQADAALPITINLLGAVKGTVRVTTDGSISDGDYVKAGAAGVVVKASTTDLSFGRAVIPTDCSKASGDPISIIPMAPAKYVF